MGEQWSLLKYFSHIKVTNTGTSGGREDKAIVSLYQSWTHALAVNHAISNYQLVLGTL